MLHFVFLISNLFLFIYFDHLLPNHFISLRFNNLYCLKARIYYYDMYLQSREKVVIIFSNITVITKWPWYNFAVKKIKVSCIIAVYWFIFKQLQLFMSIKRKIKLQMCVTEMSYDFATTKTVPVIKPFSIILNVITIQEAILKIEFCRMFFRCQQNKETNIFNLLVVIIVTVCAYNIFIVFFYSSLLLTYFKTIQLISFGGYVLVINQNVCLNVAGSWD